MVDEITIGPAQYFNLKVDAVDLVAMQTAYNWVVFFMEPLHYGTLRWRER